MLINLFQLKKTCLKEVYFRRARVCVTNSVIRVIIYIKAKTNSILRT